MAAAKYEINMTEGSLTKSILRFSLPLIATNILQLLYNAADVIVVGKFAGTSDLAAVGATSSLINLLINIFIGLSVGTAVLASQSYGSKDFKRFDRVVHTSVAMSVLVGIIGMIVGVSFARPLLSLMQTPDDVMGGAALYMQIYFLGVPAALVYNFCASILRSVGDTKRPLYILTASGFLNVVLNLISVIVFKMGIAGVAIATASSNYLSAVLVLICLKRDKSVCALDFKKLKIHKRECVGIIKVGVPAGLQGMFFSFANVIIQSSVNCFGSAVIAGSTASSNIENFVYMSMNAVYQASLTAVSQNFGAKNKKRVYKAFGVSLMIVTAIGVALSAVICILRKPLLGLYTNSPEVVSYGEIKLLILCIPHFLCGIMEVFVGFLRGVGYSIAPTIASLLGACGFRLLWIYTVFRAFPTIYVLYAVLPISWVVTILFHSVIVLGFARKKIRQI